MALKTGRNRGYPKNFYRVKYVYGGQLFPCREPEARPAAKSMTMNSPAGPDTSPLCYISALIRLFWDWHPVILCKNHPDRIKYRK
jgi:hypothetical protein